MDLSFFVEGTGPQTVQLPDPAKIEQAKLVLEGLRRQNRIGELDEQEGNYKRSAREAYNRAMPEIVQSGFDPRVISRKLQEYPDATPFVQAEVEKHAARVDAAKKTDAEVYSKKTDTLLKQYSQMAGLMANELQKNPNAIPDKQIANFYGKIADNGLAQFMPTLPFSDWSDKGAVAQHLRELGGAFYAMTDQTKDAQAKTKNEDDSRRNWANTTSEIARREAQTRNDAEQIGVARGHLANDNARTQQGKWTVDAERGIRTNAITGEVLPLTMPGGAAIPQKGDAKKRQGADAVLDILDQAEPLIAGATGSYLGAAKNMAGRAVGFSSEGANKVAKLKVLQASLMMSQPRMEGPQSDKDVQLYREAAGQIGDPTSPDSDKRAAIDMIRALNEKYASPGRARQSTERPAVGAKGGTLKFAPAGSGADYIYTPG